MTKLGPAQTCRFCGNWYGGGPMVRYGVRHSAHFDCYLDAGKSLDDLRPWQVKEFPRHILKQRGLLGHPSLKHRGVK
jgi:hypothetical protein